MSATTQPAVVAAMLLDADQDPAGWLYLVTASEDFERLERLGCDVALMPLRFSVTDARAAWRARLGRLIMPWRWRRLLLNEGVTRIRAPRRPSSVPVVLGALLAGARVGWLRS
jgi:hypothetical protein